MLRRSQEQAVPDLDVEEASPTTIRGVESSNELGELEDGYGRGSKLNNRSRLRIDMPPPDISFTLAQNATPGWETPWTSAHPNGSGRIGSSRDDGSHHDEEKLTPWQKRRKRFRAYMMYNLYVPLVRRFACLPTFSRLT